MGGKSERRYLVTSRSVDIGTGHGACGLHILVTFMPWTDIRIVAEEGKWLSEDKLLPGPRSSSHVPCSQSQHVFLFAVNDILHNVDILVIGILSKRQLNLRRQSRMQHRSYLSIFIHLTATLQQVETQGIA